MTKVPLKILITSSKLLDHPEIKEQIEKLQKVGHEVTVDDSLSFFDFITGPNCWLLRPEVAGLFTIAITNARKVANADQERVNQVTAAKARKKPARSAKPTGPRSRKVKGVVGPEGPSTADQTTFITGDTKGE